MVKKSNDSWCLGICWPSRLEFTLRRNVHVPVRAYSPPEKNEKLPKSSVIMLNSCVSHACLY